MTVPQRPTCAAAVDDAAALLELVRPLGPAPAGEIVVISVDDGSAIRVDRNGALTAGLLLEDHDNDGWLIRHPEVAEEGQLDGVATAAVTQIADGRLVVERWTTDVCEPRDGRSSAVLVVDADGAVVTIPGYLAVVSPDGRHVVGSDGDGGVVVASTATGAVIAGRDVVPHGVAGETGWMDSETAAVVVRSRTRDSSAFASIELSTDGATTEGPEPPVGHQWQPWGPGEWVTIVDGAWVVVGDGTTQPLATPARVESVPVFDPTHRWALHRLSGEWWNGTFVWDAAAGTSTLVGTDVTATWVVG